MVLFTNHLINKTKRTYPLYSHYVSPQLLPLLSLFPCYSLDSLGRHLLNALSSSFLTSVPQVSPSPTSHILLLRGIMRFFTSLSPSWVPSFASRPRALVLRMIRRFRWRALGLTTMAANYSLLSPLSPFFYSSITFYWFLALLRPSSAPPGPVSHFPSLGSGPPYDAKFLLGVESCGCHC